MKGREKAAYRRWRAAVLGLWIACALGVAAGLMALAVINFPS